MINSLFYNTNKLFWFLFHIALGIISTFTPLPFIIFFYFFLILSLRSIFFHNNLNSKLSFLIVYLVSFELLARLAQTSPYIPYELGKYLMMLLLIIGILNGKSNYGKGFILFILLIPALFYDFSGKVIESDIRFNLLGTINIGLSIWFFSKQKFTNYGLYQLLILLLLPLISVLSFIILKTPDFEKIDFSLSANFDTTGGFGSNQVATALGLGTLLSFYLWLINVSISTMRILDFILIFTFTIMGLLSFSRGGMIGGAIGIVIVLLFSRNSNKISKDLKHIKRINKFIILGFLLLITSFYLANSFTNGKLLLRYQGETEGTLSGTKEKSLNSVTTNRFSIFESDLNLFSKYGILGVGAGASKYLRNEYNLVSTHVESSRLLAEHGILGVFFIIIILGLFFDVYKRSYDNIYKSILFALLFLGWYTSFHAATRTYITPLLMGLGTIFIVNGKSPLSRK